MSLEQYHKNFIFQSNEYADKQKQNAWLLTLNDLLSLLLTFFILLYSLSEYSEGKWRDLSEEMIHQFGQDKKIELSHLNELDTHYLYQILIEKKNQHPELNKILIRNYTEKLIISIPVNIIFNSNNDEILLNAESIIYFLSSTIFELKNRIDVNALILLPSINSLVGASIFKLNLKRANNFANMVISTSFASNVNVFIFNKEFYKIEPEYTISNFTHNEDRFDIIIYDKDL